MQLFYLPLLSDAAQQVTFDREESRHIVRVLRKQAGDLLHATNGRGTIFTLEIVLPSDSKCTAKLVSEERQPKRPYRLHLAVAPTKMNDRYEWFLEKATEIGVDEITPVICDHSERKVLKTERMEKIIQSAVKQSLQAYMPILNEPVTLKQWLKDHHNGSKLIAHCAEGEKISLKNTVVPSSNVTILIGPEGDFSHAEIALARESGFIPVTLGDTRLRTETAAIAACHSIAFINES